jgi:hypothetical protein
MVYSVKRLVAIFNFPTGQRFLYLSHMPTQVGLEAVPLAEKCPKNKAFHSLKFTAAV